MILLPLIHPPRLLQHLKHLTRLPSPRLPGGKIDIQRLTANAILQQRHNQHRSAVAADRNLAPKVLVPRRVAAPAVEHHVRPELRDVHVLAVGQPRGDSIARPLRHNQVRRAVVERDAFGLRRRDRPAQQRRHSRREAGQPRAVGAR